MRFQSEHFISESKADTWKLKNDEHKWTRGGGRGEDDAAAADDDDDVLIL